MNKELKFSMKFDTGDFDRAVEKMQQKLKDFTNMAKGGSAPGGGAGAGPAGGQGSPGGGDPMMTKPGMESFFKSMQSLRTNMHSAVAQHAKEQMKLMKDIAKEEERRGALLKDQEKISKNKTKDLQEELRIKKELKNTEEQISRLTNQAGKSGNSFQAARAAVSGNVQPVFVTNWQGNGQGGGGQGGGGGGGGQGSNSNFWKSLGKSLGVAATILSTGATVIDSYTNLPLTKTASLGSATQSIIGSNLQEISNGNVVQSMAWQKEKARAMQMAQAKMHSQMVSDPMNVVSGATSLVTGGGIGSDRSANMLMGSLSKALSGVLSVSAKGSPADKLSQSLGKASEDYFTTHQAQLMEEFGKNYESMLAAQQKENPLKNLAVNYFQDRYKTDMQSQRMMGMNDKQFYGRHGFMEEANNSGFTGDMAVEQARQIQAAGGSTRSMRGNSLLALKAARGMDLTNAGSVMGTVSSGAGDSGTSERIFKKILEEGVKNGLDKSEAVEELRRFSQQTAEIVAKTGAVTGDDAQRIMENFSRFQNTGGIPTSKEQEGSKAAYKEYQGFSGETGGRGGAMQFASMMNNGLGKIGPKSFGEFMEMPEEDITATNDRVVAAAARYGMSPGELAKNLIKAKQEKADTEAGFNPKYRDILQKNGITGKLSYDELMKQPEEVREAYDEARKASAARSSYETAQKADAVALRFQRGGVNESLEESGTSAAGARVEGALEEKPGDRAADDVVESAGVAAQAMLENFRDFKSEITPAADALDLFTKKLVILAQVAQMTPEKDRAAMVYGASQQLSSQMSAQQAGKPTPK